MSITQKYLLKDKSCILGHYTFFEHPVLEQVKAGGKHDFFDVNWGACPAQCWNYGARFYDAQIGMLSRYLQPGYIALQNHYLSLNMHCMQRLELFILNISTNVKLLSLEQSKSGESSYERPRHSKLNRIFKISIKTCSP
jgi:hypothetical protein